MSEIICSYKINNQPEQSYFLMERNASFQQFIQFLHSSSIIDQSYSIYHLNNLVDSEETFNTMLNSIHQTNNVEFIFKNNNQTETSEVLTLKNQYKNQNLVRQSKRLVKRLAFNLTKCQIDPEN